MQMKQRVIIYEELNVITFYLSIINIFYFKKQYFLNYSAFIKKYLFKYTKKMGIEQIHLIPFLGVGIQVKTGKQAIEIANKIVEENPLAAKHFIEYLNDERSESLIKKIFVNGVISDAYKYTILKEFIFKNKSEYIYYFPTTINFIARMISDVSQNVIVVRWHCVLLDIIKSIKIMAYLFGLGVVPFYVFVRLMRFGKISLRKHNHKIAKKIMYFHRYGAKINDDVNKNRVMYYFDAGTINLGDCIHTCLIEPFSNCKANYLEGEGGIVYNYQQQKNIFMIKSLFLDYYKHLFPCFYALSFNIHSSFLVIKAAVSFTNKVIRFKSMLEQIDTKLAVFESEMGIDPSIFTILANKYGVKTMTLIHGYGGYCWPDAGRANTVVNYYLVPGIYYKKYLRRYSPHVDEFVPIGNHEIENIDKGNEFIINGFNRGNKKVIGILVNIYWPFFVEYQRAWCPLFDENDAQKAFSKYWLPFFKWAARQDDCFFVFNGKCFAGVSQYSHPFLKDALSEIPQNKYYQNDEIPMKDVISVSDYCICSGDSSAFYSSLILGTKTIGYEMLGFVEAIKYNKHIIAQNADELIKNLKYIMDNSLPESLYDNVRKDHHAEGELDNQTPIRIKKLIDKLVEK
jgi:hypothetical protein